MSEFCSLSGWVVLKSVSAGEFRVQQLEWSSGLNRTKVRAVAVPKDTLCFFPIA